MSTAQVAVKVGAGELPVYCPSKAMPIWSSHPKVFLDVSKTGEAACPYCGTKYVFEGEIKAGH